MQQTSKLAYAKREANGQNDSDRVKVYNAIKRLRFGTKGDIARHLRVSQEAVHKRLSELKSDGHIKSTNYKKVDSQTGHLQNIWALANVKQINLAV